MLRGKWKRKLPSQRWLSQDTGFSWTSRELPEEKWSVCWLCWWLTVNSRRKSIMIRSWAGVAAGLKKRDMKRCYCYVTGLRADLRVLGFVVSDTVTKRIMRLVLRSQHRGETRPWGCRVGREGDGLDRACSTSPPLCSCYWWWRGHWEALPSWEDTLSLSTLP